jgi:S-adenosylmethionine:tRNA ribosyltransferase-isomerase
MQEGRPIIAVGTTVVRTLESAADTEGGIHAGSGTTTLFIRPGYLFKIVDGIITNFHVPKSSLLMLVAAFTGREKILEIYNDAIARGYRLFSFGDAMLIL